MQLQEKETPEDIDIAAVFGDIEAKLKTSLKTLETFQLRNADNIFSTGGILMTCLELSLFNPEACIITMHLYLLAVGFLGSFSFN